MRKKQPVPLSKKFLNADPLALRLLQKLLSFDPKDRLTAEEALADPYFKELSRVDKEPSCQPISKIEFEFERRKVTKEDVRELIYREILEYHPQLLKDYINGNEGSNFIYPSAIGQFKKQFAHLEENCGRSEPVVPLERKHVSLPRSTVHSSTMPLKPQPMGSTIGDPQVKENMKASECYGNLSSSSKQPPRVLSGTRRERIVELVVPHKDGRSINAATISMQNAMLPQKTASPQYYHRPNMTPSQTKPKPKPAVRSAHEVNIDINTNPYNQPEPKPKPDQYNSSRNGLDAKLMQAQPQFGRASVNLLWQHTEI